MTRLAPPVTVRGRFDGPAPAVPDIWVYRRADQLIKRHGPDALNETERLIGLAVDHQDADRVLLMLRVRLAVTALQAPPAGPLH